MDHSTQDSPQPLAVLRDYELLERLGQGGMGTVYRARHMHLDKQVAIKLLPRQHLRNPEMVARFRREMKAVGKLQHPNIIQAFDGGEEKGGHFLALEYAAGLDIRTLISRLGPLSVADACEIIRQAAVGLQHAHDQGLVHRDIKPANLLLAWPHAAADSDTLLPAAPTTEEDLAESSDRDENVRETVEWDEASLAASRVSMQPVVKVLDLGLALLNGDQQSLANGLTETGQVMGTLDYMAPEQTSDTHAVDIRADIYSLGCTLYALLAGRPPFAGSDYNTVYQKIIAHNQETPRALSELRRDIPEQLQAVIDRLLAKDPADRFPAPAAVAAAVEPFCQGNTLLSTLAGAEAQQAPAQTSKEAATQPHASSALEPTSTHELEQQRAAAVDDELLDLLRDRAGDETRFIENPGTVAATALHLNVDESPTLHQARKSRKQSRWQLVFFGGAAVVLALVALLAYAIVIRVNTPYGTVELQLADAQAEVTIDGQVVKLRPKGEDAYTIRVDPGQRLLKVEKDGFRAFLRRFEIGNRQTERIVVRLIPEKGTATARGEGRPAGGSQTVRSAKGASNAAVAPAKKDKVSHGALSSAGPAAIAELRKLDADIRSLLTNAPTMPDPLGADVRGLVERLVSFRRAYPGTQEALHAARLRSALPAPADRLSPADFGPYELEALVRTVVARGLDPSAGGKLQEKQKTQSRAEALSVMRQPVSNIVPDKRLSAARLLRPAELVLLRGNSRWHLGGTVQDLAWSRDDRWIAMVGSASQVTLWDTRTGEIEWVFDTGSLNLAVALVGEGDDVAATTSGGALLLIDRATGQQRWRINAHTVRLTDNASRRHAVVVGDDATLLTAATDGKLKCWRVRDGSLVWEHAVADAVVSLDHARSQRLIACGDGQGRIHLLDWAGSSAEAPAGKGDAKSKITKPSLRRTLRPHMLPVDALALHPTKPQVVSASGTPYDAGTVKVLVHETTTGKLLKQVPADHRVVALDFDRSGNQLAMSGWIRGYHTLVVDTTSWQSRRVPETTAQLRQNVQNVCRFDSTGTRLAQAGYYGACTLYDLTGNQVERSAMHTRSRKVPHSGVCVLPNGQTAISLDHGYPVAFALVSARESARNLELARLGDSLAQIEAAADGKHCLSLAPVKKLLLRWNAAGKQAALPDSLDKHRSNVVSLAVFPGPKERLATGGWDGEIWLWEGPPTPGANSGRTLAGHKGAVQALAFSAGGTLLASLGADKTVRLWRVDPAAPQLLKTLHPKGACGAITFHPRTGHLLHGRGTRVEVYDPRTDRPGKPFVGPKHHVLSIDVNPTGELVAAVGLDSVVHVWDADTRRQVARFPVGPLYGAQQRVRFTPDGRHLLCARPNGTLLGFRLKPWSKKLIAGVPPLEAAGKEGKPVSAP